MKNSSAPSTFGKPHVIYDVSGNLRSAAAPHLLQAAPTLNLTNTSGHAIGKIQCAPEDWPAFQGSLAGDTPQLQLLRMISGELDQDVIRREHQAILFETSNHEIPLEKTLFRVCAFLRSFLSVENCSVFGLIDGVTLTGLAAITPYGKKGRDEQWNYSSMNISGIVSKEKKPYLSQNPSMDPNFAKSDAQKIPANFLCFPILCGGEIVGVINFSTKATGPFEASDFEVIQDFCALISHLIKEDFERHKSERFLATSANLGKYLSKNRVRQIASEGTSGGLGGTKRKVVALFSDIRSFTTISESLAPAVLVELLNFYFEEMVAVVETFNGTVDKLVGDLMMVLWNIPHEQPEAEVLALKAALEMQKIIAKKVAPKWREHGVENFGVGIGINSGEAIAGNIGSHQFMNYTVIGNTINTAQRLEAKAGAGEIWVHEGLWKGLEGKVIQPVRKETKLALKGLSADVGAYVFRAPKTV